MTDADSPSLAEYAAGLQREANALQNHLNQLAETNASLSGEDRALAETAVAAAHQVLVSTRAQLARWSGNGPGSVVPPASIDPVRAEDELLPVGALTDPITGLPGRDVARKALRSFAASRQPRYVVMAALDRIRYMVNRYGPESGRQALKCYGEYLQTKFPDSALWFRWGGDSFVGLFDHPSSPQDLRATLDQIVSQRVKFAFESKQRSVLLYLSGAAWVQTAAHIASEESLLEQFDQFLQQHSARQAL